MVAFCRIDGQDYSNIEQCGTGTALPQPPSSQDVLINSSTRGGCWRL